MGARDVIGGEDVVIPMQDREKEREKEQESEKK